MTKKTGRTAVRMKDVADVAGVSRMAASAVLMGTGNGRIRVSEETAEAIRKAASDLGYRPNIAAQQLAGKRSNVVALVVRDTRNFLTQKVTAELQREAEEHGLRLLSVGSYPKLDGFNRSMQDLDAGWVDGVIYLAYENEEQWSEVGRQFQTRKRVLTVLNDPGIPGTGHVSSDVTTGAAETIEHLISTGRKQICLITEESDTIAIQRRIEVYRQELAKHGIDFGNDKIVVDTKGWLVNDPTTFPKFDKICRYFLEEIKADAIICDTDFNAVAICRSLRRLNIAIGEQVAVVGWGDLQFSSLLDPPLTTVEHDLPGILKAAINAIQSDTPEETTEILVPTRLRIRNTS
ncbi:LacI family transcriptional regulator [Bremerella cremea]|uniref:LacI family transcriptional regulator n=1 Tax=Bremerella cremea TaxID=1031537 RepID=A0A368KWK5_9BACT|nr:LacI family DNA-binding transcriptional regulator [Bremerella cremea]RCS54027.1 LacI family transcriptional regulator [Bremerella cremea]